MKIVNSHRDPNNHFLVPESGIEVDFINENDRVIRRIMNYAGSSNNLTPYLNDINRLFELWKNKSGNIVIKNSILNDDLFYIDK